MSYIYGAPCKARNFNVVYTYIYGPKSGNAESRLFLFAARFDISMQKVIPCHMCVNTLPATKVTLITEGI
jgi:hypothetical protein